MTAPSAQGLAKNQYSRENEFDVAGEALLYRSFRHFWHPVIHSSEVTDRPRRARLCGEDLVVVRLDGEPCVFRDLCAHRGAALSLGKVHADTGELACAYHGWRYDRSGTCTLAPQRPDLAQHLKARIRKYRTEERYGLIWVCLEDEPRNEIPRFPQFDDPAYDTVFLPVSDWKCSPPRRTENFTDLSHFAFVHDGFLGDSNFPGVPPHKVWREDGLVLRMKLDAPMFEPSTAKKNESIGGDDAHVGVTKSYHVFMPLTVLLDSYSGDQHYNLFFHPTPIEPGITRNFTIGARNFGSRDTIHDEIVGWNKVVYEQDRPILESQRPEQLPEDLTYEMHVHNVDTFSLNYRRWLLDLAKEAVGNE